MKLDRTSLSLLIFCCSIAGAPILGTTAPILESGALTGGGQVADSPGHLAWISMGQSTPVTASLASSTSLDHGLQPGLIPTLYPRRLPGDTDDNGVLRAPDVVLAVNREASPEAAPLPIVNLFNADTNYDLRVDSADAAGIADLILQAE